MGKTQYKRLCEFLKMIKETKGKLINTEEFKLEIRKNLGNDVNRTIIPYIKLMQDTNLIVEEGENVRIK